MVDDAAATDVPGGGAGGAPGGDANLAETSSDAGTPATGENVFETDQGPLKVTPVQHASVLFEWMGQVIYADPSEGEFAALPKADVIVITHRHGDHLKAANLTTLSKATTKIFAPASVAATLTGMPVTTMANGEVKMAGSIEITAVAMYNTTAGRLGNHPKGDGNSYVLKLGNKKIYVSGDTECTDELKALTGIDVAFLCMNLPFTMPVEDAAACTKIFAPKVVYPYHFRNGGGDLSDLGAFKTLVGNAAQVRIARWYPTQKL